MANTEYEHAGNADQIRAMQFDPSPRCELCHYAQGYKVGYAPDGHTGTVIALAVVMIKGVTPALFCQLCIALCGRMDDPTYKNAATIMRPLPPMTVEANRLLMTELQGESNEE